MLRDYQQTAVSESWEQASKGERPIIVSPTGSGKTYIAGALAAQAREQSMRVLVLTPRREILAQTIDKTQLFGIPHGEIGVIMGADTRGIYRPVQIASWSTLVRRSARSDACLPLADLVIVDECHLSLAKKLKARVLDYYGERNARIIGMTATPQRKTGYGLGDFFTSLVRTLSVQELIDRGYLVSGSYWGGEAPDLAKLQVSKGEYVMRQASERCRKPHLVGDVLEQWLKHAGDRHTIVFCCDIPHAHAVAERFTRADVPTRVITDRTPTQERDELTTQFRAREIQVLCNVQVASYGFDCPSVDCIVMGRPTKSLVLHLQMLGRGLRAHDGKNECIVLDHAGNVLEHGLAEEGQYWSLETGKRVEERQREKRASKPVECADCHHIFTGSRRCPKCGWQILAPKRDVRHVDGDLVQITKERRRLYEEKRGFYFMLKAVAEQRGYKPGWDKVNYKEKYKEWPPWSWDSDYEELKPIEPSPAVLRWVQSRMIAYAKRRKNG